MPDFINDANGVPMRDGTPTASAGVALELRAVILSTLVGRLGDQTANLVFAGPGAGDPALPVFRFLVSADIPGGINATKIGEGAVSDEAFYYLAGATSNIQDQLNALIAGGGGGGSGFTSRGEWVDTTPYVVDDIVTYTGQTWHCILDHTADSTEAAGYNIENPVAWELWAARGINGTNGTIDTVLPWDGAASYGANASVTYGGQIWRAAAGSSGGEPGVSGDWAVIVAKGANGTGFTPRGEWAEATAYVVNDIATGDGQTWRCITNHTSHESIDGNPVLGDLTYWELWAKKGLSLGEILEWDIGTSYFAGDIVYLDGQIWKASNDSLGNEPADGSTEWEVYIPKGTGFNPRGTWVETVDPVTNYAIDDIVTLNGQTWRCILAHASAAGVNDPESGSSATYWELWAKKGIGLESAAIWDSAATYPTGSVVSRNGQIFRATADVPASNDPDDATYSYEWSVIISKGTNGTGFNPRGEWVDGIGYVVNDIVTYGGQTYRCILDHTASAGGEPPYATYWELWAAKGVGIETVEPWDVGITYAAGDVVSHNGQIWKSVSGGDIQEPGEEGGVYWSVLIAKGIGFNPILGGWTNGYDYAVNDIITHGGQTWRCILDHNSNESTNDPYSGASATYWELWAAKGTDGTLAAVLPWDSGTAYATNDVVSYTGQIWKANGPTTIGDEPGVALVWDVLISKGANGLGFNPRGAWVTATMYFVNDIVTGNGQTYRCTADHTSDGSTPGLLDLADPAVWELWAAKGTAGESGTGFTPRGPWAEATVYNANDIVTGGGQTWRCTNPHTAHEMIDGNPLLGDPSYWELWAAKGENGAGLESVEPWDIGTAYVDDDLVTYSGSVYKAIGGGSLGVIPDVSTSSYWELLVAKGDNGTGFNPRGAWEGETSADYAVNDIVTFQGQTWRCTNTHHVSLSDITLDNASYWGLWAAKGATGVDGIGFNPRGAWTDATNYLVNDIVTSGGQTFRCISNHDSALDIDGQPNTYDTGLWELWAKKGDGLQQIPEWDNVTNYVVGNIVHHNNAVWKCDTNTSVNEPGVSNLWDIFEGFNYRGTWVTATLYFVGDIVIGEGQTYRCISQHTSDGGTPGTDDLSDATRWEVWAKRGDGLQEILPWDIGTTYLTNDVVSYGGQIWKSFEGGLANEPGTDSNWIVLIKSGDGFDGVDAWDVGVTYGLNDLVTYNGQIYKSILGDNLAQDPESATTYWLLLLARGLTGDNGTGFNARGEWVMDTDYTVNDIVTHTGQTWRCIVAHHSFNEDANPNIEDVTYWELWAARGTAGGTGDTGAAAFVDPGTIVMFAGATAPVGWLLCDGSAVDRGVYGGLFSVIADTYGVGDGSTTFNVPDLSSRFPVGPGGELGVAVAQTGGGSAFEDNVEILQGEGAMATPAASPVPTIPPYLCLNFIIKT